jgi:hypothetical protein
MANPSRYDLREMTPIQTEIHINKLDVWNTVFADVFEPTARNSSITVPMQSIKTNKGIVDYKLDENGDYLINSFLVQEIPRVKVAPEYLDTVQIKWCDYFGINLFKTGILKSDDVVINTLTPITLFHYMKTLMDPRILPKFLRLIGHKPELTTWSSELPEDMLGIHLPWYYSLHLSRAIPMFLMKDKDKIIHRFEFLPIDKLLRMRMKDDEGEWKEVPFNNLYIQYNTSNDKYLQMPEMYARISSIDDDERNDMKCECKQNKGYSRFIDDFIVIQSTEEFSEGQTGTIHLNYNAPCKAISFLATNTQFIKHNNYCNFTTEDDDWPITHYSLSYGNAVRIPETSIFLNEIDTLNILPSNIDSKGICTHCFDPYPTLTSACSGPVFDSKLDTVFKVQFKDPKNIKNIQRYTLVVVLWVTKKLLLKPEFLNSDYHKVSIEPDMSSVN